MKLFVDIFGLEEIKESLKQINNKLDILLMNAEELTAALTAAGDKLEKAKGEIVAEIEKLKAGGELSPEAQAAVARLEQIAQSLDDIVPDVG